MKFDNDRTIAVLQFLEEIELVCMRYGFCLGSFPDEPGFVVEPFKERNITYLRQAADNTQNG